MANASLTQEQDLIPLRHGFTHVHCTKQPIREYEVIEEIWYEKQFNNVNMRGLFTIREALF